MRVHLISDTHFFHKNIQEYCQRPANCDELMIRNWQQAVKPEDLVIHLGDVFLGSTQNWRDIVKQLPGRKTLIRGNHDMDHSCTWWMEHGFDFVCDTLHFRNCILTHYPLGSIVNHAESINIHGHIHNVWDGCGPDGFPKNYNPPAWRRLFAVEYTNYCLVDFDKFVYRPQEYKAIRPV